MLDQYFNKDDDLGVIRSKIHAFFNAENGDTKVLAVMAYINTVLALNLLTATNKEQYIGDYFPERAALISIEKMVADTSNPYIRSRLFDILQVNKKSKFQNAQNAINAYLEIADGRESLSSKRDFLLRIVHILKGLGKGNKVILDTVFQKIKQDILKADPEKECYSVTALITALIELKAENPEYDEFITLLQGKTANLWGSAKFECYRYCQEVLIKLLPDKALEYATNIADAYVGEGDELLKTPNISQHMVADKYQKGFRIYKSIGIKDERIAALALKLAEAQQKAAVQLSQIGTYAFELKVNPELVLPEFNDVFQAIFWLVSPPLPSKDKLLENINKRDGTFLDTYFSKSTMSDAKGNIIGVSENNADQIYMDGRIAREIYCKTVLAPMYNHFTECIAVCEIDVAAMVSSSQFVPPERVSIVTRGLFHGFCGNLVEAVHLLVPQLENGLKTILNNKGIVTRKLDREIQTEKSLQHYFDELDDVLSDDLLFDLDGLLNQPFGDNLRHELAHGLCETNKISSYLGLYTWWLALKICLQIQHMIKKQS